MIMVCAHIEKSSADKSIENGHLQLAIAPRRRQRLLHPIWSFVVRDACRQEVEYICQYRQGSHGRVEAAHGQLGNVACFVGPKNLRVPVERVFGRSGEEFVRAFECFVFGQHIGKV